MLTRGVCGLLGELLEDGVNVEVVQVDTHRALHSQGSEVMGEACVAPARRCAPAPRAARAHQPSQRFPVPPTP